MSHPDDRIQQLCKEAIAAQTPAELEKVIPELRAALEEHTRQAKERLKGQRNTIAARDAASAKKDSSNE